MVQKGHYLLKPGAYTVKDIILNFGLGIQNPVKVTIAPGISMDKIAQTVSAQLAFSKEEFIHDSYRNRLGNGILLVLVRSCMNRHALDDERLELNSESSEALSSDAERE